MSVNCVSPTCQLISVHSSLLIRAFMSLVYTAERRIPLHEDKTDHIPYHSHCFLRKVFPIKLKGNN
jgi:hypothetical protein